MMTVIPRSAWIISTASMNLRQWSRTIEYPLPYPKASMFFSTATLPT